MGRPIQADVAKLAGVSRATVSYVLNGTTDGRVPISAETQQRVLQAIEELGYEPDARAQSLRSGSTNTIGLMIPNLQNPHFCEFTSSVEEAARNEGYQILLSTTTLNDDFAVSVFKDLARHRFDGLIIMGSFILESKEALATLAHIRNLGLPVVEMGELYGVDSISADYRKVTKEIVEYLISLGHQRIGFIYGVGTHELGLDRLEPYFESLNEAGYQVNSEFVVECGPEIEDGYQTALKLLSCDPRPTAIIVINDLQAISVIRAATDLGLRIPDDLSVVSFDDIPMANYIVPRLTTATKNTYIAGKKTIELLLKRMKNPKLSPQSISIPAKLIIRESTGPAPH